MKVLLIANNFDGIYHFRREVVKAIMDAGNEIIISAPFDDKVDYFRELGCKLINTRFKRTGTNPIKDLGLLVRYIRQLKQNRPDVVLSYTIKPNLYGGMACGFCGVPQIANITGLGSAVENQGWLQKLTIFLYKLGLKKTKTVFFQNKGNMEFCELHKMVPGRKILIPGSGVNLSYHSFQEYPEDGLFRFIYIGRIMKEKGIEEYLEMASKIKNKYPNTEFHIVGSYQESYHEKIKNYQDKAIIIYHGRQKDVRPFIGMCHCTIHPSFYPEGMSNTLLESCAAGRPIITTGRPGCGEAVDNGINGYIVKQQDSDDLYAKVEQFILLPYEKKKEMGNASRKKVEREFDRQIVIKSYLKEIENISILA